MTDTLIVVLGATMIYLFAISRIEAYVRALGLQGLILFLLVVAEQSAAGFVGTNWAGFLFLGFETLVVKTAVIPLLLLRAIRRNNISREIEPNISQFYSVLLATAIFLFGFITAYWAAAHEIGGHPFYFGVAISIMISSLVLIVSRKRIVTHILCYMTLENGIFLLSLAVANETPLLVSLGVLLDLFVAVYLFVIFMNKIHEMFDGDHIDVLTDLRD